MVLELITIGKISSIWLALILELIFWHSSSLPVKLGTSPCTFLQDYKVLYLCSFKSFQDYWTQIFSAKNDVKMWECEMLKVHRSFAMFEKSSTQNCGPFVKSISMLLTKFVVRWNSLPTLWCFRPQSQNTNCLEKITKMQN